MGSVHSRVLLFVAVGLSCGAAARSQTIWNMPGLAEIDHVGDIDGDGHVDLIVSTFGGPNLNGNFSIVRGSDGSVIRSHAGLQPGDMLGTSVCGVGDINGDGFADYMACALQTYTPTPGAIGYAQVFSGLTGLQLAIIFPLNPSVAQLGGGCRGLGDIDGDSVPDLAVVQAFWTSPSLQWVVYSGASYAPLYTVPTTYPNVYAIRPAIAGVSDVDGDGYRDVVVGNVDANPPWGGMPGSVALHAGPTGTLISTWYGVVAGEAFGSSLAPVGDVTGDGIEEVAVGAYLTWLPGTNHYGSVRVISLATGATISGALGHHPGDQLGAHVVNVGDFDLDGISDYAATSWSYNVINYPGNGPVCVYSTATGELLAAPNIPSPASWPIYAAASTTVTGPVDYDQDGRPDMCVRDSTGVHPHALLPAHGTAVGAGGAGPGGAPEDVLKVNGLAWLPARRVMVPWNQPITVSMSPPSGSAGGVPFIVFGKLGYPTQLDELVLPLGIGTMAFEPWVLNPASQLLFVLADSFPVGGIPPIVASTPAPWSLTLPNGLPPTTVVALQPVLLEAPATLRVGNAIVVVFR